MLSATPDFVRSYLDLPREAKIDQFIVRDTSDPVALAQQYALTSAIRPRLEVLLTDIKNAIDRNLDLGRFIFGSFGSGKSHFLRIVGMMLANDQRLYANARDAALREVHAANSWLDGAQILVVHTSMMGVEEQPDAFIRHLADAFDETLEALGQQPLRAFGTEAAFSQFEEQCRRVPTYSQAFSDAEGYDRATFARLRGEPEGSKNRIALARVIAKFVAGSEAAFQPTNAEARAQMAGYAKELGYKAIAFTIDEFVLWAQGISGANYAAAVNALNALVESADVRAVPFIVLTAVQRNIMSVFPDDRSENVLREHLKHVSARFPEVVLEDSNLVEIAQKRVLAPLPDRTDAWRTQVRNVCRTLADSRNGVLVGEQAPTVLEQLYPFHPALLRVLSDVTQGLQRERSSLFMLYQLLTTTRAELKMGEIVSLGALWDVLFSQDQIDGLAAYTTRGDATNAASQLLTTYSAWNRLRESIRRESGGGDDERVLDLAVKSVLLMQLSHSPFVDDLRGLDKVTTVENLYRLNRNEVAARTETMGVQKILAVLRKLATAEAGTVSIIGDGPTAVVQIELNAVDLSELMDSLRPTAGDRFSCLLGAARETLGLAPALGARQEGRLSVTWRATERFGRVRFESYSQFSASGRSSTLEVESGDDFKLGILLEDDANGSVQEAADNARARVESAREHAQAWAVAWVPAPLSSEGREALERLAKLEVFRRDRDVHLARFKGSDHPLILQRLEALAVGSRSALKEAVARAYGDVSRVITMRRDPPELHAPANVDLSQRARAFAAALLELRYRQYPKFARTPNPAALNQILTIYRGLLDDPSRNAFAGDDLDIIQKVGEPLELFEPGLGVTNVRASGTYLSRLKEWFDAGERSVRNLIEKCAAESWGLSQSVVQTLIAVLASREGLRLTVDGVGYPIERYADVNTRGTLTKGVLPPLAEWNAARTVASAVLHVADIPSSHTVSSVDALVAALPGPLKNATETLKRCVDALEKLRRKGAYDGASPVEERYRSAYREMLALSDTDKVVSRLAGLDAEKYGPVIAAAGADAEALEKLTQFRFLGEVVGGSAELRAHLSRVLTDDSPKLAPQIGTWRAAADKWIEDALTRQKAPEPPSGPEKPEVSEPLQPKEAVRLLKLPRWGGDLTSVMDCVRTSLGEALTEIEAEGCDLSIELRMRAVRESPGP